MITVTILLSTLLTANSGAKLSPTQSEINGWWKAPSGSYSCLPDEQIAGCQTLVKNGAKACYCPFPQH